MPMKRKFLKGLEMCLVLECYVMYFHYVKFCKTFSIKILLLLYYYNKNLIEN